MRYLLPLLFALPFLPACELPINPPDAVLIGAAKTTPEIPASVDKIIPPKSYTRIHVKNETFSDWLRKLPLRKDNVLRLYNGDAKPNQTLHYAILNVPYKRDALQQCADAVMRLRAEYIYETKSQPTFLFLHQRGQYFTIASNCTRPALEQFLHKVFNWCGTYNLQTQLKPVANINEIKPGDVFIKAGSPGHAMLVADVAENAKGEKMFMLLQSFIPAQEIHLVINPYHPGLGPWYSANDSLIVTPGWTFTAKDLRKW